MFKSKYSNFLTILLIVAIIVIIAIVSIVIVGIYKKQKNTMEATKAISDFDNTFETGSNSGQNFVEQEIAQSQSNGSQSNGTRKVTYYNNFVMLGYIEIPKIKIKYPILEEETVASLEQSVAIRYPSHATLNSVGNVVIVGHNYRNGMFFSNLKKVETGDKVKITDTNGQTKVYTVYEVYETTPEDTAYITRNVGENIEVTLVTCTDDSKARIIVKARV